ncbi:hypothetical protein JTE90_016236 [Oedothorax gibbosus]|uniref:Uncharacterized protein n=1 Tax=Oedothorax gibbosus TaxID=931172 RepID=A0AAV6VR34_9ARAC|nr:hypothetical protein JTE90_016236 [Oedothorax gibbosus]
MTPLFSQGASPPPLLLSVPRDVLKKTADMSSGTRYEGLEKTGIKLTVGDVTENLCLKLILKTHVRSGIRSSLLTKAKNIKL